MAAPIQLVQANTSQMSIALKMLKPGENYSRAFMPSDEEWAVTFSQLKPEVKAGTITPILVSKPDEKGIYTVLAGFQRYRAGKEADVAAIPCQLTGLEPASVEAFDLCLAENLHREQPSFVEVAKAAKQFGEKHGIENWHTSKVVAKFTRTPLETLKIMRTILDNATDPVLKALHRQTLDISGARVLAGLEPAMQEKVLGAATVVKANDDAGKAQATKKKGAKKGAKKGKKGRKSNKVNTAHIAAGAAVVAQQEGTAESQAVATSLATKVADSERSATSMPALFAMLSKSSNEYVSAVGQLLTLVHAGEKTPESCVTDLESMFMSPSTETA